MNRSRTEDTDCQKLDLEIVDIGESRDKNGIEAGFRSGCNSGCAQWVNNE